jgi:GxxExxY protein
LGSKLTKVDKQIMIFEVVICNFCELCASVVHFHHKDTKDTKFFIFLKQFKNCNSMSENEISSKIIGAAIEAHKQLGPGLLESTYETCLAYELKQMELDVKQQQALPVVYKEVKLDAGYRIDLLIENKVIIEIKSVEALADIHTAQLLTYLKLKDLKLGLLINFNSVRVVDGLKRI